MSDSSPEQDPAVDQVRRRLLVLGGRYVAPAVIASVFFQQEALGQGMGMGASCMPAQVCMPFNVCPPSGMGMVMPPMGMGMP